jgi:NAD+ synthase (glutamine-hydrolysing)
MRIALVPLNPTIGDLHTNAALVSAAIGKAAAHRAALVVLPELCVSGYPPRDLLMQEGFVEACERTARQVAATAPAGLTFVIGCPVRAGKGIANALLVFRDGAQIATYHKRLLPTYDVFDEDRYFVPGNEPAVVDVTAPEGTVRVGLAICEDLWKGDDAGFGWRYRDAADPVAELVAQGATVLVSPSASPFVCGKGQKHRQIVAGHASRHRVTVASVNQLGGNDELVFDGHCFAFGPDGGVITNGLLFRDGVCVFDTLPDVKPPRSLVEGVIPRHLEGAAFALSMDTAVPEAPQELLLFEALVLGVRDYLRKTGFGRAIIGLSGGIDSALTAAVASAAIGADQVLGVAMPSRYSSEHSLHDAAALASALGMHCITVPIQGMVEAFRDGVDPALGGLGLARLGERLPDLTEENLQSRVRGTLLMALSNRSGAIVLTTGNKSEMSVGYATLYGDMNGGLAVLSDLTKQWVYRLSRWLNANASACGYAGPPIPESSITKAPSAELRPNQTDQDSLPPYEELDEILARYVLGRESPASIAAHTGITPETVRRIVRLIDSSEYKRKQAATGLKVTSVAFGSGRRWPIAQRWSHEPPR